MIIPLDSRNKSIVVGAAIFILTIGWAYFLDQMRVTPDFLLLSIGSVQVFSIFLTVAFAGFVVLFTSTLGLITAYADKDDRTRVYLSTVIPSLLASAVSAILFSNFAQWYPLALFYFGSIPLMIESARLKRLELKNFAVFRSNYAGAQRGLQIIGIGVLVTLAVTSFPQTATLYSGFESALFQGKVVQQLDVQEITADFLIATQKNTLNQVIESDAYGKLRTNTDPDVIAFVELIDATFANVQTPAYRTQIVNQVVTQQERLDTQALLAQIQSRVPGYSALRDYYWALASFLGSLVFFLTAMIVLQPLSAVFGSVLYTILPDGTASANNYPTYTTSAASTGGWGTSSSEPAAEQPITYTGWESPASISSEPAASEPVVPTYTHVDDPASATVEPAPAGTPPQ